MTPKSSRAHAEHGRAVHLRLTTDEVRLLRMQVFAVLVLPGLFRVIAVVEEDGLGVPVQLFLRHERATLKNQYVLVGLGQVQCKRSAACSRANDNRVVLGGHAH